VDKLNHPLARGASYLLIYLTALQPLHPAFAAGINAANGNTQVQQGNVPVVNIATPNGAGISHNSYQDFNVAAPGAVLNNAAAAGQSQLAGQLNANGNLKGKAAELIINEVTGGSRSELQGKLEVFGNKANVMIANPNGISCDGCGFINAPGVTLTTGKPQFDKQGALEALEVKKGLVTIGGKGLDGYSADYVDIISRATEVNGQINANSLSLTQGANRISFKDGTIKPIAGEGAKPVLAVDTKALGGMYANKIRLVANEDGVGVNLKDLITNQRDITLNVNGKITLNGTTRSKTDLNVSAKELLVVPWSVVQADQDATLASQTLTNAWKITASRDIRVFSDTVSNVGADAKIRHANRNLWIQKDAQGNKANLVENRSATIKTNSGDLVIRTERLNNVVDKFVMGERPDKIDEEGMRLFGEIYNAHKTGNIRDRNDFYNNDLKVTNDYFKIECSDGWECIAGMYTPRDIWINNETKRKFVQGVSTAGRIEAGANLYANASSLYNNLSEIRANKDIILTGNDFTLKSQAVGSLRNYIRFAPDTDAYREYKEIGWIFPPLSYIRADGTAQAWNNEGYINSLLSAGGNLVADFKNTINFDTALPYDAARIQDVGIAPRVNTVNASNIVMHANNIYITDSVGARTDLTIQADDQVNLGQAALSAGRELSITAINNIDAWQSRLQGTQVNLISRSGDIKSHSAITTRYFHPDGNVAFANITANDLMVNAGKNILLNDTELHVGWNITGMAGKSFTIFNNDRLLPPSALLNSTERVSGQQHFNRAFAAPGKAEVRENITIIAGENIDLPGTYLKATLDMVLNAGKSVLLGLRTVNPNYSHYFSSSRTPELRASVNGMRSLQISAGQDVAAPGAYLYSDGNVTAYAGRNLWLGSQGYSYLDATNDNNRDDRHLTTFVRAGRNLTLASNGELSASGSALLSGADMALSAGGNMRFDAVQNYTYRDGGNEYTESLAQQGSELNAGGLMTVISNGSILFQATKLAAKGALDVAAKGGYLYAQAMEESSHYEKKEVKRKWWGKKTEVKKTRHDVVNKVTEFSAGGDINLLSRDDSTYEASKIAAGQNARLTSTQGKVNFRAVKNTTFEQTVTSSRGFYITQSNRGYEENKWVLPSIYTGGKLTVDAAQGITADVKLKNGQTLQNAVAALGNTPGTDWLKDLNTRNDVQWAVVKDAYDSWDYKSQHLNPAVAAVIAIAAAAVTAGAGLAAVAGNGAIAATGVTGVSASSIVYGSAYAGMTSLASQVAVALVDNQGNLSKTLRALGSSETVKATATAMAIGGALAGFDRVLDANVPADKARLPALIKDEGWIKIAQRVAGQSVISSSLNTAINGGSFKDNLTNALLANIGSQVQAEGANLIGDNGEVLGAAGRSVSHAVVAGIAAEIGRGDGKGAAAGALAAELAGVILGDNIIKPEEWQKKSEQQAQMARVLGAAAGAVFTGKSDGAYSGATSGENAFRYNYLSHKQQELMEKDLAAAKSPLDKAVVLANWGITSHTQDGAFAAGVVSGIPVEISDTVDGLVAVASNPREAADALIALIKNDDRFSIIGESVKQEYLGRVEAFKAKYEHAGMDGAYGAGLEFGKLTMAGLGLFAGAAGAGKLGVKVTTNSLKALEKTTVKDLTALGLTREQQTIIKNAEGVSTAKAHQATAPRDLNEQVLWNLVKQNPEMGIKLSLNKDPQFSTTAGFQKMQALHELPDNYKIVIHYQYNKYTGKAYDLKFDSPKRNDLQPGPSVKGGKEK
jgi:filamentous hemagglutinin